MKYFRSLQLGKFYKNDFYQKICKQPLKIAVVSALVLGGTFPSSLAWSFDNSHTFYNPVSAPNVALDTKVPPPRTMDDACIPLLKSIRYKPHDSTMVRNQRSAGKAAAVGFALGVRFALGPPEMSETSKENQKSKLFDASHDPSALAIMAYRHCQKQLQLNKTKNDFHATR